MRYRDVGDIISQHASNNGWVVLPLVTIQAHSGHQWDTCLLHSSCLWISNLSASNDDLDSRLLIKLSNSCRLSVVKSYCGHGIGDLFHVAPNVPHYSHNKVSNEHQLSRALMPSKTSLSHANRVLEDWICPNARGWSCMWVLKPACCSCFIMPLNPRENNRRAKNIERHSLLECSLKFGIQYTVSALQAVGVMKPGHVFSIEVKFTPWHRCLAAQVANANLDVLHLRILTLIQGWPFSWASCFCPTCKRPTAACTKNKLHKVLTCHG